MKIILKLEKILYTGSIEVSFFIHKLMNLFGFINSPSWCWPESFLEILAWKLFKVDWNPLLVDTSLLISPVNKNQHLLFGKIIKILYKKRDLGGFIRLGVGWVMKWEARLVIGIAFDKPNLRGFGLISPNFNTAVIFDQFSHWIFPVFCFNIYADYFFCQRGR